MLLFEPEYKSTRLYCKNICSAASSELTYTDKAGLPYNKCESRGSDSFPLAVLMFVVGKPGYLNT